MSRSDGTPVSYARDELDQIRDVMAKGHPLVCPRCRVKLQ
jgi:hypothetical protein